ncbi:hypothetical protein G647_03197 [Cladophialophora carrionii CBS 160.54]|uniref:Uncharacterized protein n=1 Tax=Cladophialophora carrionii CBS 160.54 TaxID=1279043 RepID=V9DHT6_9EURO|nr:uncharacterized protein G647_03197 [Cladophialophora carrionii CBS 160.54]ETI26420.1 hypothetical protein G647_03197 [Cladophialophora carrionii CBS 160.54]
MAAPEVRRGDFIYRDTLFVDLGPNRRHPRASAQDLKDLLLPSSKQKKAGSGSAPKDQVAHWYEAQLIHYGLPRSREKNTAKVRLTNAIASKTLVVPEEIVALEAEMKKEYASALRRAKSGGGGGGGGGGAAAAGKGETKVVESKAKKTRSTSMATTTTTSKTTVALEIDGIKVTIDREAMEVAKKKKKETQTGKKSTAAPKTATSKTATSKTATSKTATSKTATSKPKGAKASDSKPKPAMAAGSTALAASRPKAQIPKQTARRGGHSGYSVTDRLVPSSSPEKPRAKQTARRGKDDPFHHNNRDRGAPSPSQTYNRTPLSFQHDVDMDDAPPAYESIDFNQQRESPTLEDFPISGTYFFPGNSFQPFSLTLQVDDRSHQLWGQFHIGSKEGVLCVSDMSDISCDQAVSFGWRSEDQDDGFMKFGRGCDGVIEFDGEGWIRGHFNGLMYGEDVEFTGELVNDEGLDVREMKHIWDDFPRKAYGRG